MGRETTPRRLSSASHHTSPFSGDWKATLIVAFCCDVLSKSERPLQTKYAWCSPAKRPNGDADDCTAAPHINAQNYDTRLGG